MKIIGLMRVKDEGDLLPEVLSHIYGLVDDLFVFDDGSVDNTWNLVQGASFKIQKKEAKIEPVERYACHYLLEEIKKNYDFNREEIWVAMAQGDRFYLNKTPREMAESAEEKGCGAVNTASLDFMKCRADPWTEEEDTFPNYPESLRRMCRWVRVTEEQCVVWKVSDKLSFRESIYPWPKGIKRPILECTYPDVTFVEHQGRRSPNAIRWRYESGSRPMSKKYEDKWDLSTFDTTLRTVERYFQHYRVIPWIGLETLDQVIEISMRDGWRDEEFFLGVESTFIHTMNKILPPRKDI